jgi:hypothetical protein
MMPRAVRAAPHQVTLLYHSSSPHLQQIYTGMLMLQQRGVIGLAQRRRHDAIRYDSDAPHLRDANHAHLSALIDSSTRVHFDTHDAVEVANGELERSDFYFKRSFAPDHLDGLPESQRAKLRPLGLNYAVLPDTIDRYGLGRRLSLARSVRQAAAAFRYALDVTGSPGGQPRLRQIEAPPQPDAAPRVLFLAAAYDPYDQSDRAQEKIEERIAINEHRARCIGLLRKELGSHFLGGLSPTPFAVAHYPGLLVERERSIQLNYLRTLREFPICVATTGLHGSTGWKLAEYVAFSKAIVSERLRYAIPGDFAPGGNYLEFDSPEECVERCVKLMTDPALRCALMHNNASYYRAYLRPDSLVWNALAAALGESPGSVQRATGTATAH